MPSEALQTVNTYFVEETKKILYKETPKKEKEEIVLSNSHSSDSTALIYDFSQKQ